MKRQKIESRETIGINEPVVTPNGKEYARLVEVVPRYIYCADCLKALSALEESLIAYEEEEKYEKCAEIKKAMDFLDKKKAEKAVSSIVESLAT